MKKYRSSAKIVIIIILGLLLSSTPLLPVNAQTPGVGTWNTTTAMPAALYASSSVTYKGYVYEIGGSNGLNFESAVYSAPLNSNGTVGAWNTTTALPVALENTASVVYNGYVYLMGGYGMSGFSSTVYYAPLNSNGTVGTWNTTTALPDAMDNSTSLVYSGYIYELGGEDVSGGLQVVYSAPLNSNGTVGTWNTTTALPAVMDSASSAVYNGYVYELGGSGFSNAVYDARLNSNGTVGTWNTATVLPDSLSYTTSVAYNGYIYELGGQKNNFTIVSTVYSAPLSSNGTVGTWSATTAMPNGLRFATSVTYNGYVYELGGQLNNSSIASTVYSAEMTGYPLPGISNHTSNVTTGSSITVNVLNGVSGNPDSSTLSIVSGPSHGTAVDPPGTITYTPNKGYVGTDSLVYQVCSLNDEALCSQATLKFNVTSTSVAPDTGYGEPTVSNPLGTFGLYSTATLSLVAIAFGMRKLSSTKSK